MQRKSLSQTLIDTAKDIGLKKATVDKLEAYSSRGSSFYNKKETQQKILYYITLYTNYLQASKSFYESLGLKFTPEKHGEGPPHYSTKLGSTVFEVYPRKTVKIRKTSVAQGKIPALRFGIALKPSQIKKLKIKDSILKDPDGNIIEILTAVV